MQRISMLIRAKNANEHAWLPYFFYAQVFFYQTFKLPMNRLDLSDIKYKNQDTEDKNFIPSSLYPIILPLRVCRRLSTQQNKHETVPIRIPLLVKFSLDSTLMVLQLSDKILKIVAVTPIQKHVTATTASLSILPKNIVNGKQQQWNINLSKEDSYIKANSSSVCDDSTKILPGGVIW